MCPLFCLSWFALAASAILEWVRLFYWVSNGIILAKELTKGEDYFLHCLFISRWHGWKTRVRYTPQMHEMIKMSLTTLLTALCLCASPGDPRPVAFHEVFDLPFKPLVKVQNWSFGSVSSAPQKQRAWGDRTDNGDMKRNWWVPSQKLGLILDIVFSELLWFSVLILALSWGRGRKTCTKWKITGLELQWSGLLWKP